MPPFVPLMEEVCWRNTCGGKTCRLCLLLQNWHILKFKIQNPAFEGTYELKIGKIGLIMYHNYYIVMEKSWFKNRERFLLGVEIYPIFC